MSSSIIAVEISPLMNQKIQDDEGEGDDGDEEFAEGEDTDDDLDTRIMLTILKIHSSFTSKDVMKTVLQL